MKSHRTGTANRTAKETGEKPTKEKITWKLGVARLAHLSYWRKSELKLELGCPNEQQHFSKEKFFEKIYILKIGTIFCKKFA